ncbi:MAG: hypothetical protein GY846_12100 [Deltaproteobacteria bacterium]|nr:hypothetical protein [Deltaproteobacteria bacterium]
MKTKRCFISLKDAHGMAMIVAVGILFLSLGFMAAVSGCSDSDSTAVTNAVIASAVSTDEEGTVAIASVTQGDLDIENATVSVNEVSLTYGMPLEFRSEEGFDVDVTLPIYYADLSQFTSGDRVDLVARADNGALIYKRSMVTIPGKPTLLQPVAGQEFFASENVPVQWNEPSTDTKGYVAGYVDSDALSEESTDDDDLGYYFEYVDAPKTEMTVPSAYTVVGDATFSVTAVSGDTDIFTSEEDPTDSFLVAGATDWIEGEITADSATQFSATEDPLTNDRGSQGLSIAKEYTKKIKGYRFKIRETDPNQISAPGTVQLGFKMRRYKVSIAFVQAFDMNGKQYYSWEKKRIYKSKSKKYYPSFSVSVGTTIVFGTHDASYRGGTYSYSDERPIWIRFFIGTEGMGIVKCDGCSTAEGCSSLWIPAGSTASCQATPASAYKFSHWTANGNYAGDNPTIRFGKRGATLKGHFPPN